MVELFLAALALFVWLHVADGTVRDIAFVIMLIGGMSTVLFNGNPLLRFDGYYVLSDLLDIPNLGSRSNAYIVYLAQRRLLGVQSAVSPVTGPGEAPLLFGYAVLSFAYRWFVAGLIILWAGHFSFWAGILVGAGVAWTMVIKPLIGLWRFLTSAPQLSRTRTRSMTIAGGVAAAVADPAVRRAVSVLHARARRGLAARAGTHPRRDRRLRDRSAGQGWPGGEAGRSDPGAVRPGPGRGAAAGRGRDCRARRGVHA